MERSIPKFGSKQRKQYAVWENQDKEIILVGGSKEDDKKDSF